MSPEPTILARQDRRLGFHEIADGAHVEKGFLFSAVALPLADGSNVRILGVHPAKAVVFLSAINDARCAVIARQIAAHAAEIGLLLQALDSPNTPRRYPAACLLAPFLDRTRSLFSAIPADPSEDAVSAVN